MTTEKQQQANAKNALLSSGPVTPEGKGVVARNAIKHGIFAKDLVIATGDGRENELEYHKLLAGLEKDLTPAGQMEALLVEKIALNYWRLRRLVRYETGEIQERLDDFKESALDSYYDSSYSSIDRPEMEYYDYEDCISESDYQERCSRVAEIKSPGFDLMKDKDVLEHVCYHRLNMEEDVLSDGDYDKATKFVAGLSPQMKGKLRKEIFEVVEQELAEMGEVLIWREKFDQISKRNSLPIEHDLNKIIKYENSLERSIFRNLAALKTLQGNRTGPNDQGTDVLDIS